MFGPGHENFHNRTWSPEEKRVGGIIGRLSKVMVDLYHFADNGFVGRADLWAEPKGS